jgi:hypothetical protein
MLVFLRQRGHHLQDPKLSDGPTQALSLTSGGPRRRRKAGARGWWGGRGGGMRPFYRCVRLSSTARTGRRTDDCSPSWSIIFDLDPPSRGRAADMPSLLPRFARQSSPPSPPPSAGVCMLSIRAGQKHAKLTETDHLPPPQQGTPLGRWGNMMASDHLYVCIRGGNAASCTLPPSLWAE